MDLSADALVPLLAWGVFSMGMGAAFLVAPGFLIAALVKVGAAARAHNPQTQPGNRTLTPSMGRKG